MNVEKCFMHAEKVSEAIKVLMQGKEDEAFEIRCIKDKITYSGIFADAGIAAETLAKSKLLEQGFNAFITLNRFTREKANEFEQLNKFQRGRTTIADKDIVKRRWLLIDLDVKHGEGESKNSTNEQLHNAETIADNVKADLSQRGWPQPVVAMSGNGMHLLYAIDVDTSTNEKQDAAKTLIVQCLKALETRHNKNGIKVDQSVLNSGRISALYGTLKQKDKHTEENPQRMTELRSVPEHLSVVTLEQLQALASESGDNGKGNTKSHEDRKNTSERRINNAGNVPLAVKWLENWCEKHGIELGKKREYNGGYKWPIQCPFYDEHGGTDATDTELFVSASGEQGFKCQHDHCNGKEWKDFRLYYEPEAYDAKNRNERDRERFSLMDLADVDTCEALDKSDFALPALYERINEYNGKDRERVVDLLSIKATKEKVAKIFKRKLDATPKVVEGIPDDALACECLQTYELNGKTYKLPQGFSMQESGLYCQYDNQNVQITTHRMAFVEKLVDMKQGVLYVAEVEIINGMFMRFELPEYVMKQKRDFFNSEFGHTLAIVETMFNPLVMFFQEFLNVNPLMPHVLRQIGWHGGEYWLPTIQTTERFAGKETIINAIKSKGTFSKWLLCVDAVTGRKCGEKSHVNYFVAACVGAAFIPVLRKALDMNMNMSIVLCGQGRLGKSKTFELAASAIGIGKKDDEEGVISQYNGTRNYMESHAGQMFDLPIFLDDVQTSNQKTRADAKEFAKVYANNEGKGRADRKGKAKDRVRFKGVLMLNCENRIIDSDAEVGANRRVIQWRMIRPIGKDNVLKIVETMKENYGVAFPLFVDAVKHIGDDTLRERFNALKEQILAGQNDESKFHEHVEAIVAIALAHDILHKDCGESIDKTLYLSPVELGRFLYERDVNIDDVDEGKYYIEMIQSWTCQNERHFNKRNACDNTRGKDCETIDCYGTMYENDKDCLCFINLNAFTEFCKKNNWSPDAVGDALLLSGYIAKGKNKQHRQWRSRSHGTNQNAYGIKIIKWSDE